jgi:hypothetical protein
MGIVHLEGKGGGRGIGDLRLGDEEEGGIRKAGRQEGRRVGGEDGCGKEDWDFGGGGSWGFAGGGWWF